MPKTSRKASSDKYSSRLLISTPLLLAVSASCNSSNLKVPAGVGDCATVAGVGLLAGGASPIVLPLSITDLSMTPLLPAINFVASPSPGIGELAFLASGFGTGFGASGAGAAFMYSAVSISVALTWKAHLISSIDSTPPSTSKRQTLPFSGPPPIDCFPTVYLTRATLPPMISSTKVPSECQLPEFIAVLVVQSNQQTLSFIRFTA
mmetsp:Transcript_21398/g.34452  ORF Transcript_21398/g.34452 Transcript_21398/m.34452 type:complete len:206 (-) Transcript_21398:114-731(-)